MPQKLNDPEGEVGYLLRFFPETFELGRKIVEALGAEGIERHDAGEDAAARLAHLSLHVPGHGARPGRRRTTAPSTCPIYRRARRRDRVPAGDCPVADDLFDRMITIPLNQWYTPEDCQHIAAGDQQGAGGLLHARRASGQVDLTVDDSLTQKGVRHPDGVVPVNDGHSRGCLTPTLGRFLFL